MKIMLNFFLAKVKDLGKSKYVSCTYSLYIHIHKPQNLTKNKNTKAHLSAKVNM